MISPSTSLASAPATANHDQKADRLRAAAQELEATFLFEMLKSAGVGEARSAFGGGAGEDQFASVLLQEQADMIARKGGLGLADHIYASLLERDA